MLSWPTVRVTVVPLYVYSGIGKRKGGSTVRAT